MRRQLSLPDKVRRLCFSAPPSLRSITKAPCSRFGPHPSTGPAPWGQGHPWRCPGPARAGEGRASATHRAGAPRCTGRGLPLHTPQSWLLPWSICCRSARCPGGKGSFLQLSPERQVRRKPRPPRKGPPAGKPRPSTGRQGHQCAAPLSASPSSSARTRSARLFLGGWSMLGATP